MKELNFGEEIREHLHPKFPDLKVATLVPDDLRLVQIADRLAGASTTEEGIQAGREVLAELVRSVSGIVPKRNGETFSPTLAEWAEELFRSKFEFRRNTPVQVLIDGGQVKHPISGLPLQEGEYRVWQNPRTLRSFAVLWDREKNEPVSQSQRVRFGNFILENLLFNAQDQDEDSGKGSPTLSADQ